MKLVSECMGVCVWLHINVLVRSFSTVPNNAKFGYRYMYSNTNDHAICAIAISIFHRISLFMKFCARSLTPALTRTFVNLRVLFALNGAQPILHFEITHAIRKNIHFVKEKKRYLCV